MAKAKRKKKDFFSYQQIRLTFKEENSEVLLLVHSFV